MAIKPSPINPQHASSSALFFPCSNRRKAGEFLAGGAPTCYGKTPILAERGDSAVPPWYPWTPLDLAHMHIFYFLLILQYPTTTEAHRRRISSSRHSTPPAEAIDEAVYAIKLLSSLWSSSTPSSLSETSGSIAGVHLWPPSPEISTEP
jgi:hypothetical protein